MELNGSKVLITGGATGIGFALAKEFIDAGSTVLICGRREDKLKSAVARLGSAKAIRCDISKESDRKKLYDYTESEFKDINILVNNAGIQRNIDLTKGEEDLLKNEDEIEINLKAQIRLTARFIPIFMRKSSAAIINVSSGLGFVPMARFPVYSATKAAMHSFSMSLRHQLKTSSIQVFEIIPPTVYDTELKGKPLEKTGWTLSTYEVAKAAVNGLKNNDYEIAIGPAKRWSLGSREETDAWFIDINH